jgi:hypothetical protein
MPGSTGQANYAAANTCLDGWSAGARAQGLASTSVQWGAWGGDTGGMASGDSNTLARLDRMGVGALSPEQGLFALSQCLSGASTPAVLAVNPFNWTNFERSVSAASAPRYESFIDVNAVSGVAAAAVIGGGSSGGGDVQSMLEDVTRSVTEAVLPLLDGQPTEIDPNDPLMESGLDSLGRACQILPAMSSIRILHRRFLSSMASFEAARIVARPYRSAPWSCARAWPRASE